MMTLRIGRAAAVTALSILAMGTAGCSSPTGSEQDKSTVPTMVYDESQWQWVGLHALEVRAPAGWGFQREVGRPDCVDPEKPGDMWGASVPTSPYVTSTAAQRAVPMIGCVPPRPGNPDPAFGDLPFSLWQPHVRLDAVGTEVSGQTGTLEHADGEWTFEGWHLARRTFDDVQVSVLSAPGSPDLSGQVFASARSVEVNTDGCATTSPFGEGFPIPEGVRTYRLLRRSARSPSASTSVSRAAPGSKARGL